MLRDISTRRKLVLLCSAFVIAIAVAIYISVAEKRIAIDFARQELGGVDHIEQFQDIYAALLRDPLSRASPPPFPDTTIYSSAESKSASQDSQRTAALEDSLKRTLSRLWSGQVTGDAQRSVAAEALTKTERVISRIGDDSGLALDPELDSYHLQDILVRQMPKLLSQLGDVWSLASASQSATTLDDKTRLLTRVAIARTTSEELARSLTSAYRANATGRLRRGTEATMAVMLSSVTAYLGGVNGARGPTSPNGKKPSTPASVRGSGSTSCSAPRRARRGLQFRRDRRFRTDIRQRQHLADARLWPG